MAWWLTIVFLGACVGSFLNVVIYRWPRGLSVLRPARSYCPACTAPIAWYDNIPVLSYLVLRGRCRRCRAVISLQYPLVELAAAVLFLVVYDAFFVARLRQGVVGPGTDWPLLLGHWVLVAGLLVLTVMDLEAYMVDIRVTGLVSAAGVLMHTLWTPATSMGSPVGESLDWSAQAASGGWLRPGGAVSLFCLAVTLGLAIRRICQPTGETPGSTPDPPAEESPARDLAETNPSASPRSGWWWMVPLTAAAIAYVWSVNKNAAEFGTSAAWSGPQVSVLSSDLARAGGLSAALAGCVLVLALAAGHPRPEIDREVDEALHAEAPDARRMALGELRWLGPALALAGIAVVILISPLGEPFLEAVGRAMTWRAAGDWRPVWGLATGLSGWVIGGMIGWSARIVFTLCLGKEALGLGDVHILAAAGAVAGWPVACLGFFLAAPLALVSVGLNAARRRSHALPYGPWLAAGFVIAAVFQDVFLQWWGVRWLFE